MKKSDIVSERFILMVIILIFAVLYYVTLHGIGGRINPGDSAKWQLLGYIKGTPHPTGYPLYLILSKVAAKTLLFFDEAKRITMISYLSGLFVLYMMYKTASLFIVSVRLRFLPMLIVGTTYIFWVNATEAEVYSLNALFVITVCYFLMKYLKTHKVKFFLWACFFYALSFGNHLTMITMLPCFFYVLCLDKNYQKILQWRYVLIISLFVALGLFQYFYIYTISHDEENVFHPAIATNPSFAQFWEYITGGSYKNVMFHKNFWEVLYKEFPSLCQSFAENLGLLLLIIPISTFFRNTQKSKWVKNVLMLLIILVFCNLIYVLNYGIPAFEKIIYAIPSIMAVALLLALSIDLLKNKNKRNLLFSLSFFFVILNGINAYHTIKDYYKDQGILTYDYFERITQELPNESIFVTELDARYPYRIFNTYNQFVLKSPKRINIYNEIPTDTDNNRIFVKTNLLPRFINTYQVVENDSIDFFPFLEKNKDKVMILSSKLGFINEIKHNGLLDSLQSYGLKFNDLENRGGFIAVIQNGKNLFQEYNPEGEVIMENNFLDSLGVGSIYSSGITENIQDNKSAIYLKGGEDISMNQRGLNIVVIDPAGKDFPRSYNVDSNFNLRIKNEVTEVRKK